jgi:hypothetical protein
MGLRHPHGVLATRGHVGRVAVLLQAATDEAGHLHVVFDHENAHAAILIVIA